MTRAADRAATDWMARRASESGLLVAAGAMPETFQRTLIPRSDLDQALVSGLTFTIDHGLVSTIQSVLQALAVPPDPDADLATWQRRTLVVDLAAIAMGLAVQRALPMEDDPTAPDEPIGRSTVRTTGLVVGITGLSGAIATLLADADVDADPGEGHGAGRRLGARWQLVAAAAALAASREFGRRRRLVATADDDQDDDDVGVQVLRSLGLGVAVGLGATGLARLEATTTRLVADVLVRLLPGGHALWRPVGRAASLATFAGTAYAAARPVYRRIEKMNTGIETALDVAPWRPEVSGSDTSTIPYDTMGRMGRRMVWTLRTPIEIERVMGEPAQATPIRVYGGLRLASTPAERVTRVLDDLERAGGLDRDWLLLVSPTGTGYANYAALGALEFLARGNCATVAMQYSARPSPLSLDRVAAGREQFRILVDQLGQRLATRPAGPRIVVFGESLGAWTSQDAFLHQGTQGLVDAGIDHALWIGTPFGSKWKDQVLGPPRDDVDPALVGVTSSTHEWATTDRDRVDALRYLMLTHHDDAVAWFDESLAVRRPRWLGPPATRPAAVPRAQRWIPVTTFLQTLVDMKNAAQVVPGVFAARGHDYRADLAPVLAGLLGLDATDEQQVAIRRALEAEEAVRTRWITEHRDVGSSMAAVLLRRIRQESPEAFEQALAGARGDMAGWMEAWEERAPHDTP